MEGHGCLKQRFYTSRFLTSSFYPDTVKDLSLVELQLHSTMGVGEQGKQGIGHLQESLFSTVFCRQATPTLSDLWVFNKQMPVDLGLGAKGVCGLHCSALITPKFSF